MSTRCTVNFCYENYIAAKVYRHSDGYPDGPHGVPASLEQFFSDVEEQTNDTRFGDPTYLAAKYVVWESGYHNIRELRPLDFLGVGVCQVDPGDIEFTYYVLCDDRDENGRPTVKYRCTRWGEQDKVIARKVPDGIKEWVGASGKTQQWEVLSQRTWASRMEVVATYGDEQTARWHFDKLRLLARDGRIYDCGLRIKKGEWWRKNENNAPPVDRDI